MRLACTALVFIFSNLIDCKIEYQSDLDLFSGGNKIEFFRSQFHSMVFNQFLLNNAINC